VLLSGRLAKVRIAWKGLARNKHSSLIGLFFRKVEERLITSFLLLV
jgi:hypothetical protein